VTRKRYSAEFKAKIATEALKGHKTCNEIASEHGLHPVQVSQWKKQALDGLTEVFGNGATRKDTEKDVLIERLYQEVGQLKVELDWLKKKSGRLR